VASSNNGGGSSSAGVGKFGSLDNEKVWFVAVVAVVVVGGGL